MNRAPAAGPGRTVLLGPAAGTGCTPGTRPGSSSWTWAAAPA